MTTHPRAGKPAPPEDRADIPGLVAAFHRGSPDPDDPSQRVAFGTSGHRGSSLNGSFNEAHVLAIAQAVAEHRTAAGITGPLFLGKDTHALSGPALESALEVFAGNGMQVCVDADLGYTPTPVISHAILSHHGSGAGSQADGVILTPSHNPPEDGGLAPNALINCPAK